MKLVLQQLLEALKTAAGARTAYQALHQDIASAKSEWLAQWMPKLTATSTPINPYRVVWDLMHTVDRDNVILTHESGSAREYAVPFWEARQPRSSGASRRSWDTAWDWRWEPRWPRRTSR